MRTVLYVHGTGVREPSYGIGLKLLRSNIAAIRPDFTVAPCYWGGVAGAQLGAGGISIPVGQSDRSIGDMLETQEAEIALWALLEQDPLFELGLVAANGASPSELPPNAAPPGVALAAQVRELQIPEVTDAGMKEVFPAAVDMVLSSEVGREALRIEPPLCAALARAVVAQAMRLTDERLGGTLELDGDHRDGVVSAIVAQLGGSDRSVMTGIGKFAGRLALSLGATKPIERRRATITRTATSNAGDVLMYLVRGAGIRDFIRQQIEDSSGPLVIIAHSLGGIACVDLLSSVKLPAVALLITVGSQISLLYELNALPALTYGAELPAIVPTWINVYDRRDLLSYTAEGVFPGRVADRLVDNRSPFPRSHSAYFKNTRFYDILDEVMP